MLLVMMLLMMMPDMTVVITTDNDYTAVDDELFIMMYFLFIGHNTEIRIQALTPLGIRKQSSPRSYTQGCQGYAS